MRITHLRRPGRLAAITAAALTAGLLLAGCTTTASTSGSGSSAASTDAFKAVVLTDGPKNDQSWSNSVFDGLSEIDKSLNVKTDFVGPLSTPDEYVQQGSAYASQGYKMILITNGAQTASAIQLAKSFPDVTVCQGPISPTTAEIAAFPSNFCAWNLKQQDGTFLAGVLAGLVTKTNKLASVAGGEFPAVIRQPEGFILGARCVNPDVTIDTKYINSFSDVAAAQAAAQTQVAAGADVILSAVDGAVKGLYSAAEGAPQTTYVIPSYFDSYEQAPKVVLTSVLYNLNGITADLIQRAAQGKITAKEYIPYTYANLKVGELADFHDRTDVVTPEIQAKLEAIEAKLRSGDIVVPDEKGADAPLSVDGAGSTIDPASIGC